MSLEEELTEDLTAELEITDKKFNPALLKIKLANALKDVKEARRYPNEYSQDDIEMDMRNYYSNIRSITINDYNKIGIDTEEQHTENGTSSHYVDRNKLFSGILPLSDI